MDEPADEGSREQSGTRYNAGGRVGVASAIDWNSPLKPIALAVELPFWLLMPNGQFEIKVDGGIVKAVVENTGIEIQGGTQFSRTRRNTVFMGSEEALKRATIPAMGLPGGGIVRATRTLLYLEAQARSDALEAFFGNDERRYQDGNRYMASLAVGQLKAVNSLINSYRRAAVDPFANEVTAWDLPVWFIVDPPRTQSVCCYAHLVEDWFPTIGAWGEPRRGRPIYATTPERVSKQLDTSEIPGEIELLDGWSLFHRGRYGDSIRSFVTAVEVLLESQIRTLMKNSGETDETIEARLAVTRTNFENRMLDYCRLSRRRIPGPKLHPIPYINGIHLLDEMSESRRLRHRIVHHGHRLDEQFEKLMLRAAETTTWLFDWLSDGGDFEKRRRVNSTLFFAFRTTQSLFPCDIVDGKITVLKPAYADSPDPTEFDGLLLGEVIYSEALYFRTIGRSRASGKDIESFTQMSLFELGMGELEDSAYAEKDGLTVERFYLNRGSDRIAVHLLDIDEKLNESHIEELAANLGESNLELPARAILIANDQRAIDWTLRPTHDDEVDTFAKEKGISVLRSAQLARLTVSAMRFNWSKSRILDALLQCARDKLFPPASRLLGTAYKYWPSARVIGIASVGQPEVNVGDVVAIETRNQFRESTVTEVRLDDKRNLTLKLDTESPDLEHSRRVFLMSKDKSYDAPAVERKFDLNALAMHIIASGHGFHRGRR